MLSGKVSEKLKPYVELEISGLKKSAKFGVIVDTGSTFPLILSTKIIQELGLEPMNSEVEIIGVSGSKYFASLYQCSVRWNGATRRVAVAESPEKSLLGMPLIEGLNLQIAVSVGGDVTIG